MDPVASEALGELIATAVSAAAGGAWKKVRRTPEGRAVKAAIDVAVRDALRVSAFPPSRAVDDAWVDQEAKIWRLAFTAEVSRQLVACLADPSGNAARRFAELAKQALLDGGRELGPTFWVEEFLAVLPRQLFDGLREASVRDPAVRELVGTLLMQRADARANEVEPPTPGEFRQDVIALLRGLDEQALTGRLPPYLPAGADVTALSRTVRVRLGVRSGPASRSAHGDLAEEPAGRVYRLPVERTVDGDPPRPWPEVARQHRRLVVLADPGLGKSWLIRTETHRLCKEALARPAEDPRPVIIPVPMRCDQMVAAEGRDLADKAAAHLVAQGLLARRSGAAVAAKVRAGEAVVLLDALDELTQAEVGPLRDLVRSWAEQAGSLARCVTTSRIAGYTGSPLPGAREVELQAFTAADVAAAVEAWRLPPAAASDLRERLRNPATSGDGTYPAATGAAMLAGRPSIRRGPPARQSRPVV